MGREWGEGVWGRRGEGGLSSNFVHQMCHQGEGGGGGSVTLAGYISNFHRMPRIRTKTPQAYILEVMAI